MSAVAAELVHPPASVFVASLLAAGCFSVVAIVVDGGRGRRAARLLWGAPLVVAAAALGRVWDFHSDVHSDAVGIACTAAAIVAFAGAACFGAVPWPSRILGAWGARRSSGWRRTALVTTGLTATALATLAVVGPSSAVVTAAYLAIALAQAQVGMALLGVRQWRFAPRPRIVHTTVLAVGSVVVVAAAGALTTGDVLGAVAIFTVVVATTAVALPVVDVDRRLGQRNPESRNASR